MPAKQTRKREPKIPRQIDVVSGIKKNDIKRNHSPSATRRVRVTTYGLDLSLVSLSIAFLGKPVKERKLNKTTKLFPYRSSKLTMQFRILFNRQP